MCVDKNRVTLTVLQSLERVDDHVSGKENIQSSEPEVLALVHLHGFLNVCVRERD